MKFNLFRESIYKDNQILEYQHSSGAKIIHIKNKDSHRAFCAQFRTPSPDDRGVTHIIEHCVLAGSCKYNVKEPFVEILKASLNTMTNAMTFLDRTAYVLSSTNQQDLLNSIEVYLDGLFCPNFCHDKLIFLREGWNYEINEQQLDVSGVVYNEMKGAMSDPIRLLIEQIYRCAFNNNYQFNQGGNPDDILKLNYEDFLAYYKKYYHPSNCVIVVYGDLEIEKLMEICYPYFDNVLSSDFNYDVEVSNCINQAQIEVAYPVMESKNNGYLLAKGYKFGGYQSLEQTIAIQIIESMLFNMNMSPIHKKLNGLVSEVFASYEFCKEGIFIVGVLGAKQENLAIIRSKIDEFILEMSKSLDSDFLAACVNKFRFNLLHGDGSGEGLEMCLDVAANYDRGILPEVALNKETVLENLAHKDVDYFKNLIKDLFLENNEVVEVSLVPDMELALTKNAALREKLDQKYASLSEQEINDIKDIHQQLLLEQQKDDDPEELKKIPHLELSDLKPREHSYDYTKSKINDFVLYHIDYNHNGINYYRLVFDISHISYQQFPFLNLLFDLFKFLDAKNYSNEKLLVEINKYVGYLNFVPIITPQGQYLVISFAYVGNQSDKVFDLVFEQMFNYLIDDNNLDDVYQVLDSYCSNFELSLTSRGANFAISRSKAFSDQVEARKQYLYGYEGYLILKEYLNADKSKATELILTLKNLYQNLFGLNNLEIYYQGSCFDKRLLAFVDQYKQHFINNEAISQKEITFDNYRQGFVVSSAVNYVVCGTWLSKFSGSNLLLRQLLTTDYLWQKVRLENGAYGCWGVIYKDGFVSLVSFRDPETLNTLEVFGCAGDYLRTLDVDLDKYKIGCLAQLNYPVAKSSLLTRLMHDNLNGDCQELFDRYEQDILNTTIADLRLLADEMDNLKKQDYVCIVGGNDLLSLDLMIKKYNIYVI